MSEQLYSFEGEMMTLHQIEAIRAERELAEQTVEEKVAPKKQSRNRAAATPKTTKKAAKKTSKKK